MAQSYSVVEVLVVLNLNISLSSKNQSPKEAGSLCCFMLKAFCAILNSALLSVKVSWLNIQNDLIQIHNKSLMLQGQINFESQSSDSLHAQVCYIE